MARLPLSPGRAPSCLLLRSSSSCASLPVGGDEAPAWAGGTNFCQRTDFFSPSIHTSSLPSLPACSTALPFHPIVFGCSALRLLHVHDLRPLQRAAMSKPQAGSKFRLTLALPVGAVMNCADNSGAKNLFVIAVNGVGARLNRLPAAASGDMVVASVKKGKPELRKKVMPAVVIRQRKPWRRRDGIFLYFEDNAGVIVNPKGEMKGSAITGPVAKECADLWPRIVRLQTMAGTRENTIGGTYVPVD